LSLKIRSVVNSIIKCFCSGQPAPRNRSEGCTHTATECTVSQYGALCWDFQKSIITLLWNKLFFF